MFEMNDYKIPFAVSAALHGLLFAVLFFEGIQARPLAQLPQQDKVKIVKAVSVDQNKVLETVKQIKQERAEKERAEQEKIKRLERLAQKAVKRRSLEQKRLSNLKKNIEAQEKRHKANLKKRQQELATIKAKQKHELARMEKIKKQAALDKKRAEDKEKQRKIAAQKAKAKAVADRKRKAKLAEQKRQQVALEATRVRNIINKYIALIQQDIGQHWIVPDKSKKRLSCRLQIRLGPGGMVVQVKLLRSSGDAILDRSAQAAVYKASPLPVPKEPDIFKQFRVINLTVRPESVLSAG